MKFFSLGPRANEVRPQHTGFCHDCDAPVISKYCGECGQSSHAHVASAGEFIHHFIGHFVAAEGKLWRTFADLLLRPGQLTVDYIRGRRTRHIDPLRLLLTVSLLVFATLKLQTHMLEGRPAKSEPAKADAQPATKWQDVSLSSRLIVQTFDSISPSFRKNLDAIEALPDGKGIAILWDDWLKSGPTVVLCLIPIVALFLKLLNAGTGWRYGEHLVFSIHLHAFILLDFLAWMLLAQVTTYAATAALVGLALYALLAMRRMYGGSWPVLAARWGGLVFLELKAFAFLSLVSFFSSML